MTRSALRLYVLPKRPLFLSTPENGDFKMEQGFVLRRPVISIREVIMSTNKNCFSKNKAGQ